MSLRREQALFLRGIPYGDTSLVIRLFGREQGAFSLLAKGARRAGSPLLAVLQTGQLLEVVHYLKPGRELNLLREASVLEDFRGARADYGRLLAYSALVEALDHSQPAGHGDGELFEGALACLSTVAGNCPHPVNALYWFLLFLLGRSGYYIDLERCCGCGRDTASFAALAGSTLDRQGGGLACPDCSSRITGTSLGARLVRVLLFLARSDPGQATAREITGPTRSELGSLLDGLLSTHLEHWRGLGSLERCAAL
jgi:DNA repair protein RecO (recombination protein O)